MLKIYCIYIYTEQDRVVGTPKISRGNINPEKVYAVSVYRKIFRLVGFFFSVVVCLLNYMAVEQNRIFKHVQ